MKISSVADQEILFAQAGTLAHRVKIGRNRKDSRLMAQENLLLAGKLAWLFPAPERPEPAGYPA